MFGRFKRAHRRRPEYVAGGAPAVVLLCYLTVFSVFHPWSAVLAQQRIGKVDFIQLWAFDRPSGVPKWGDLFEHDPVYRNQGVRTEKAAAAHLRFVDGTELRVGATSEVIIDRYVYSTAASGAAFVANIGKGILRVVSGRMPKAGFKIVTPTAHIGIRGTDFIVRVLADGTTIILVLVGEIIVTPQAAGEAILLRADDTARVRTGSSTVETGVAPPAPDDGLDDDAPDRQGTGTDGTDGSGGGGGGR